MLEVQVGGNINPPITVGRHILGRFIGIHMDLTGQNWNLMRMSQHKLGFLVGICTGIYESVCNCIYIYIHSQQYVFGSV